MNIVIGILIVAVAITFAACLYHRRNARIASVAIKAIQIEDIGSLADEFVSVFHEKHGRLLSFDPADEDIELIEQKMRSIELQQSFAKPGIIWHWASTTGAYFGCVIHKKHGGSWVSGEKSPSLVIRSNEETEVTLRPFEKVLYHNTYGEKGDLIAYIRSLEAITHIESQPQNSCPIGEGRETRPSPMR